MVHEPKVHSLGDFSNGNNTLQVTIHGAVLSSDCIDLICRNHPELNYADKLTSFISFDFYDFQTEISGIGIGTKPIYNHQSRYIIF